MNLYIHVPFCGRRCSYCDFAVAIRAATPGAAFVEAVSREWESWLRHPAWDQAPTIETIYFGGGTPSRLAPGHLDDLLRRFRRDRPMADDVEVTLEANPDDVTLASAAAWRSIGFNRVSLGVQTFDAGTLQWMHRTHGPDAPARAMEALRAAGMRNVSLDLIFALPDALDRVWEQDLELAFALGPEHLSLYGLTVEPRTPVARWVERGTAVPTGDDRYAAEYLAAAAGFAAHGFEHYEVSNAGLPGCRSRHNSGYWRRAPYIGLGPSAHSGLGGERRWNTPYWERYRATLADGRSVVAGREALDTAAVRVENLYLGLRTSDGAPEELVPAPLASEWRGAGWAEPAGDGRVRLTLEGWLRLDALVARALRDLG